MKHSVKFKCTDAGGQAVQIKASKSTSCVTPASN